MRRRIRNKKKILLGVIDFMSSNDTKVFFLPEAKFPVSTNKPFNLVKSLLVINVRVYMRIELERL